MPKSKQQELLNALYLAHKRLKAAELEVELLKTQLMPIIDRYKRFYFADKRTFIYYSYPRHHSTTNWQQLVKHEFGVNEELMQKLRDKYRRVTVVEASVRITDRAVKRISRKKGEINND